MAPGARAGWGAPAASVAGPLLPLAVVSSSTLAEHKSLPALVAQP